MRQALSSACFSADSEASRFRSLDSTPAMRSSRTFVDDGAWTPPDHCPVFVELTKDAQ